MYRVCRFRSEERKRSGGGQNGKIWRRAQSKSMVQDHGEEKKGAEDLESALGGWARRLLESATWFRKDAT